MIEFKNVSKSYLGKDILRSSSFRISDGERIGVVGPNGAGKTTIFGLVTGDVEPDKGDVSIPKTATIGYLRQQLPDTETSRSLVDFAADASPELATIHSEIERIEHELANNASAASAGKLARLGELQSRFEMAGGYEMTTRAQTILSGLGFKEAKFDAPLSHFSGGWQMRAALARVLAAEPTLMLLDEPSNYLDTPAVEWLARFLTSFKGTLLLISHDRFLLKHLTSTTLEVNNGIVSRYPGDYDFYIHERERRFASLQAAKRNQEQKRQRLESFVERFKAKNTKAAQAKNKLKQIDRMEEIVIPDSLAYSGTLRLPKPPRSGAEIARLENIEFSYDGKTNVLENISFSIERGAKTALVGYNGTGKTTLLRILAGAAKPTKGKIVFGHHVVPGYQAQEFGEILPPRQTAIDVVRNAAPGEAETRNVRSILGSFGFSGDDAEKPCEVLSGGEKIRLSFARIFVNPPNFLLLDEPTTHLDIAAREALQTALKNYKGTLCLVSHDIEFLRATAETIVEMTPPGVKRHFGNYDYFQEKKREAAPPEEQSSTDADEKKRKQKANKKELRRAKALEREKSASLKRGAKKRLADAEAAIERLEEEKSAIVADLEANRPDTDFYGLNKRLLEIEKRILRATEKWEGAALELEKIGNE
jgi:ATP-binding cassette subfamily F protein 3